MAKGSGGTNTWEKSGKDWWQRGIRNKKRDQDSLMRMVKNIEGTSNGGGKIWKYLLRNNSEERRSTHTWNKSSGIKKKAGKEKGIRKKRNIYKEKKKKKDTSGTQPREALC